jgi:energy-coupling factor transport system permease protein
LKVSRGESMATAAESFGKGGTEIQHGLDPRVKLLYLVWVFLLMSFLMHPAVILSILLVTIVVASASGLSLWKVITIGKFGFFVAAASWVLWIFFLRSQGKVLFSFGPVSITEPGVFNGWSVAARIAGILFAFLSVFQTISNREVMTALYRLRVNVPFAMVVGITLRLIPQLRAEHATIVEAQRSRAVEFDRGNLATRMRKHFAYMVPLILRALKITSDLSLAMEARGFDPSARRTFSGRAQIHSKDWALIMMMALTLAAALIARFLGYGGMPVEWMAK